MEAGSQLPGGDSFAALYFLYLGGVLMGWNCKPSGGYAITSQEGTENINAFYNYMFNYCSLNNIVGILCNVKEESGFNPWRWQGDQIVGSYDNGYGLFQFTPGRDYINLTGVAGHAPNLSVTTTQGGSVTDAEAQLYTLCNDLLHKWVSTCWRSYWPAADYQSLYFKHTYILNTYGNGSSITMQQFFTIDNIEDACFTFLACYEGPAVPNLSQRMSNAQDIMDVINPQPPGLNRLYGGARDVLRRNIIHA